MLMAWKINQLSKLPGLIEKINGKKNAIVDSV
jgi:hypothetical protein